MRSHYRILPGERLILRRLTPAADLWKSGPSRTGTPEGRVLSFVVDRKGYLRNICVERGLSRAADAEAVRVLSCSPRWAPGIFNRREVNIRYTVPVHFRSAG